MPIDFEGLRDALAGRYALERELGHGATATVYLARDLNIPKHVAIKVLNPDIALAVTTERFRREISHTAPLTHPYILGLTDAGVAFDTQTGGEILYYVMPYASGGSLRDRIELEGSLPVKQAVRIAWEVADALAYAHAHGTIHRDIKPGNILLGDEHIWVADFGIARKLEDAGLTATGGEPGTPPYMSPEQTKSAGVDHRSDIYALGCVLYEMLTGRPPFAGPTVESIAVQRLSGPAPAVRKSRPTVPPWLDQVVAKALAPEAQERFQTAKAFRDALRLRPAWIPIALRGAAAVVVVGGAALVTTEVRSNRLTAADTLTYAMLPVAYPDSAGDERLTAALHDELAKWTGITVVNQQRVREEVPTSPESPSTAQALKAARRLRAGRYITATASRFSDVLRVHVVLHNALNDGAQIGEGVARLRTTPGDTDSGYVALIDGLLFTERGPVGTTRSFQARRAFERGLAAVREWDLGTADSAFVEAVAFDSDYGAAHYQIARTRFWKGDTPPTWASNAQRALADHDGGFSSERLISQALVAFAEGDLPRACDTWEQSTRTTPFEFASWYGLAACLYADRVVVRTHRSLSGWRFRSSYYRALKAFQRAYELAPATHRRLSSGGYEAVRRLFHTGGNQVRLGRALLPDTGRFFGVPLWDGDSLVMLPLLSDDFRAGRSAGLIAGRRTAVQRLRQMFQEVATAWRSADPGSASALEALAISLELLGERSCLDTLIRARRLATSAPEQVRLGAAEAWMRLKFAIPYDLTALRAARSLADSLLGGRPLAVGPEAPILASLAAVTGRAGLAASVSRGVTGEWRPPGPIAETAPALLAFAALGGPVDSVRSLWTAVQLGIDRLPANEREPERNEWLGRSATLVFPAAPLAGIGDERIRGDYLVDAQRAFARGDSAAVRKILREVRSGLRRANPPESLTLDALYPEAWLLAAIGDTRDAIDWIDPTLNALAQTAPRVFADPARAGSLVRAIALRAELAERVGDRAAAARWARVVAVLWSDADAFLRMSVQDMERLVR